MIGGRKPKLNIKPKRDKKYLKWCRDSLYCVVCQSPYPDPHHLIGHGMGGMGTKASDLFIMPLCRVHHDSLHQGYQSWEDLHGDQVYWVARTMAVAIVRGEKRKADFLSEIDNFIINQNDREIFEAWLVSP